jgi:transposase InsO family protein
LVDPFYKVYTKRGEASDSRGRFIKADYRSWIWEYGIRDACNTAHLYIVYNLIMERLKYNKKHE